MKLLQMFLPSPPTPFHSVETGDFRRAAGGQEVIFPLRFSLRFSLRDGFPLHEMEGEKRELANVLQVLRIVTAPHWK